MKSATITKKHLRRTALALVVIAAVAIIGTNVIGDLRSQAQATKEAAAAATGALREAMWFDHAEGQQAWAERIQPLCTTNGWAFWGGPFFAGQVWPTMVARRYTTHDIEILDAHVIGDGDVPDSKIIQVSLGIKYTLGDGTTDRMVSTNTVVMVNQDGQWLMDTPLERWREKARGQEVRR